MAAYMEILANQRPFTVGVDENQRTTYSMNFVARSVGVVSTWERDLATIINTAGLGTLNTNMFIGPKAVIPKSVGPHTLIIDTGGSRPVESQNGDIDETLSAQITVRGIPSDDARVRALAIWREIHGTRNATV